jgi:hypothetical protein
MAHEKPRCLNRSGAFLHEMCQRPHRRRAAVCSRLDFLKKSFSFKNLRDAQFSWVRLQIGD